MNDARRKRLGEYLMVALVRKMVKRGEWVDFCDWCYANNDEAGDAMGNAGEPLYFNAQFIAWLITDPARTCELIAEWMEGKHERL